MSARPPVRRATRPLLALAAALTAAGCASSLEKRATRAYAEHDAYAQLSGFMRRDRAPADAPYSNADLARNFERIVFFSEFSQRNGQTVPEEREITLTKWRGPVRYALMGDAVNIRDAATLHALTSRVSDVTGLEIERIPVGGEANLAVMILSRDARRWLARELTDDEPAVDPSLVQRLSEDEYRYPCVGSVSFNPREGSLHGWVLIKAETSGISREMCAHEEFVQVLGPVNDFSEARPSIFNDDGEFALLTEHDEYILRILYDPRLEPGMTRSEAMPIARTIIEEIRPEGGPATAPRTAM